MFPSLILALREGLEAALVISILLGALRKFNQKQMYPVIWAGTAAAVALSLAVALALNWLGTEFEGTGEQVFEGITMLAAAGLLTWMIFWMSKQSRKLKPGLENDVRAATSHPGVFSLFSLALVSVVREGTELAIYLVAARLASDALQTILGATVGLAFAIVLGWLLFTTSYRMNL